MGLTIAIPTYDRNQKLVSLLHRLRPQIVANVSIVVIDNFSPTPVSITLAEQPELAELPLFVYRNEANIGISANIIRSFELSQGTWVWLLGDDDDILPDAVSNILASISNIETNVCAINFSTGLLDYTLKAPRTQDVRLDGRNFSQSLDCFANFLFIAANVLRRDYLLPYMASTLGYLGSGTHIIPSLYRAIYDANLTIILSSLRICNYSPKKGGNDWSKEFEVLFYDGLDCIPDYSDRRAIARKIARWHSPVGPRRMSRWIFISQDYGLVFANLKATSYVSIPRCVLLMLLVIVESTVNTLTGELFRNMVKHRSDRYIYTPFVRGKRPRD
jgi:glycosyltransferase involved in cell wall biosynthesis